MSEVAKLVRRTETRRRLGFNQTYPQHSAAGKLGLDRRYSVLIGKCANKARCPYTWVLKFNGVEIDRDECDTKEDAIKEAENAKQSHQKDNPP